MWDEFKELPPHFVLYGGTAIALQLGHRNSVDFDFFSSEKFNEEELYQTFPLITNTTIIQKAPHTLSVLVGRGRVKISFFGGLGFGIVSYPRLAKNSNVLVASLTDLFAHKLKVILQRAEAKDYKDLVAILESGLPLANGIEAALAIFGQQFPPMECLRAMTYFEGGDLQTLTKKEKTILQRAPRTLPKKFLPKPLVSSLLK